MIMFFEGKRVLVTGGTGFIGRNVVNRLISQKAILRIIDKTAKRVFSYDRITYDEADISDKENIERLVRYFNPEYIIHLAANNSHEETNEAIEDIKKTNVIGTKNILEAAKDINYRRFIFLSSGEAYFGNKVPFREEMNVTGSSTYSKSKIESEKDCKEHIDKYRKPITILRAAVVYGPGQKAPMFIPSMVEAAANGKVFEMTKGEQTRDFIFVLDLVDALLKSCIEEKAVGQTINIGTGKPIKLVEATKMMESIEKRFKKNIGARPYRQNEIFDYYFDIAKARDILHWEPKYKFEDGLRKTILWQKNQK